MTSGNYASQNQIHFAHLSSTALCVLRQPYKRRASADVFTFIKPWVFYFPCEENWGLGGSRIYSSSFLIRAGKHRGATPLLNVADALAPLIAPEPFDGVRFPFSPQRSQNDERDRGDKEYYEVDVFLLRTPERAWA